jgi:hypothetical protein
VAESPCASTEKGGTRMNQKGETRQARRDETRAIASLTTTVQHALKLARWLASSEAKTKHPSSSHQMSRLNRRFIDALDPRGRADRIECGIELIQLLIIQREQPQRRDKKGAD